MLRCGVPGQRVPEHRPLSSGVYVAAGGVHFPRTTAVLLGVTFPVNGFAVDEDAAASCGGLPHVRPATDGVDTDIILSYRGAAVDEHAGRADDGGPLYWVWA